MLLQGEKALDVERASEGRFGPDPMSPWQDWAGFQQWAADVDYSAAEGYDEADLEAPVPAPRQVFAIGLNYAPHAAEAGFTPPEQPVVFTKFPSCIVGPVATVMQEGKLLPRLPGHRRYQEDHRSRRGAHQGDAAARQCRPP